MKTRIIFAFAIILMITSQNLTGQRTISDINSNPTYFEPCLTGELFAPTSIIDPITYFNSEWLSGDIYLSNGEVVRNKLIKYNGLLDELFWKELKSNNIIKLDKESILCFHFSNFKGDTSVYFRKIKAKRNIMADSGEIFVQKIYEGRIKLYVSHTFFIDRRELIYNNGIPFEKEIYVEEPVYYFRNSNNKTFVTRSLSRKSLFAFSPENKDKISEFLKSNRPGKIVNNSYLIRLTQFLSTVMNQ